MMIYPVPVIYLLFDLSKHGVEAGDLLGNLLSFLNSSLATFVKVFLGFKTISSSSLGVTGARQIVALKSAR